MFLTSGIEHSMSGIPVAVEEKVAIAMSYIWKNVTAFHAHTRKMLVGVGVGVVRINPKTHSGHLRCTDICGHRAEGHGDRLHCNEFL